MRFRCARVNEPDPVGATVEEESLLFNLVRINAETGHPAITYDERHGEFVFKSIAVPGEEKETAFCLNFFLGRYSRERCMVARLPYHFVALISTGFGLNRVVLAELLR